MICGSGGKAHKNGKRIKFKKLIDYESDFLVHGSGSKARKIKNANFFMTMFILSPATCPKVLQKSL